MSNEHEHNSGEIEDDINNEQRSLTESRKRRSIEIEQQIERPKAKQESGFCNAISSFFFRLILYSKMALVDYKRRCCLFTVGVCSIVVCIITTMLAQVIISRTPLIFYSTTVVDTGDLDIIITAKQGANSTFSILNTTRIAERIENISSLPPLPRIQSSGIFSLENRDYIVENGRIVLNQPSSLYNTLTLVMVDPEGEARSGIIDDGITSIPEGEIYLTRNYKSNLNINVGDTVYYEFSNFEVNQMLQTISDQQYGSGYLASFDIVTKIPFKVAGFKGDFTRRVSNDVNFNNMGLIDIKSFSKHIKTALADKYIGLSDRNKEQMWKNLIEGVNWVEVADKVIVNFPNRMEVYLNGNFNNILAQAIPLASRIVDILGPYAISLELPIVASLSFTKFANTFVSLVLNMILGGLLFLSGYVIYNIMLITVDSKVYEAAVQRTIGLTKGRMIMLLSVNAFGYTILALLLGIPLSGVAYYSLNKFLANLNAGFTVGFEFNATVTTIVIATLLPLISMMMPAVTLLEKNISESLDKDRSKTQSVQVKVSNEDEEFPWATFTISLASVVIGIAIYLGLPYSLLTMNISFLILMFFGLLAGMLIGLMLIFVNFSYVIEYIISIPLKVERKFIRKMVLMNLISHRIRNRRTVVIYSLGLSFINFIFVTLIMQVQSTQDAQLTQIGSEIAIDSGLTIKGLEQIFNDTELYELVDYAPISLEINEGLNRYVNVSEMTYSNKGKIQTGEFLLVAAPPNIYSVTRNDMNNPGDTQKRSSMNPVEYLYSGKVIGDSMISVSQKNFMNIDCYGGRDYYIVEGVVSNQTVQYKIDCSSTYKNMAGFIFSGQPGVTGTSIITSFPNYLYFLNTTYLVSFEKLWLSKVLIKPKNPDDGAKVMAYLEENSLKYGYSTFNYQDTIDSFATVNVILNILFSFIVTVCMVLSLFSLISTMASNMLEQRKELAVMRCIGLSRWQIARVYMYEAMIVILSGGGIGLSVGCLMGWTIMAQNSLFSSTNFSISFPWTLLIVVIVTGIFSSLFAAGLPALRMLNTNIVALIKSIN